jgi:hypothetical protein
MKLEFLKVLRDCKHNKQTAGRKIYDYDVVVDGVKVATWCLWIAGRRGYNLVDLDREDIKAPSYSLETKSFSRSGWMMHVLAETKDQFEPLTLAHIDHIPTPGQIEGRRQERAAAKAHDEAVAAEAARVRKVMEAGPVLLAQLVAAERELSNMLARYVPNTNAHSVARGVAEKSRQVIAQVTGIS